MEDVERMERNIEKVKELLNKDMPNKKRETLSSLLATLMDKKELLEKH